MVNREMLINAEQEIEEATGRVRLACRLVPGDTEDATALAMNAADRLEDAIRYLHEARGVMPRDAAGEMREAIRAMGEEYFAGGCPFCGSSTEEASDEAIAEMGHAEDCAWVILVNAARV